MTIQISSTFLKIILCIGVVFLLGLPINTLPKLLILLVVLVRFSLGDHFSVQAFFRSLPLLVLAWGIHSFWPTLSIQEGHHIFLPHQESYVKRALGKDYGELLEEFSAYYKDHEGFVTKRSFENIPGDDQGDEKDFSFSADGLWGDKPQFSRIADHINFNSIETLRLGEMGKKRYNFYDANSFLSRKYMPYFVFYEINPSMIHTTLCGNGHIFLSDDVNFHPFQGKCITFDSQHVGQRVLGVFISPQVPLSMSLTQHSFLSHGLRDFLISLVFVGFLLSFGWKSFSLRPFAIPGLSMVAVFLGCWIFSPHLLMGYPNLPGGGDGLTYTGFGKAMLEFLSRGDWINFFKGAEPIYYYMPGMSYFRAIEQYFFGETHYGYVLVLWCIPIVVYNFLSMLFPKRWATILWAFFLFTPIFERFGFAFYHFIKLANKGFAEPIGYGLFIMAITSIFPRVYGIRKEESQGSIFFLAGLSLAASIFFRPNLAPLVIILSGFVSLEFLKDRRWIPLLTYCMGVGMTLLIPLHNWVFGGQLVLLTSSAAIDNNMHVSPFIYGQGLMEIFSGTFKGPHLEKVLIHLEHWNHLADIYRLIPLAVLIWRGFSKATSSSIRCLSWIGITAQILLLFYVPGGRYSYLAWMLTFLVFLEWFSHSKRVIDFFKKKPTLKRCVSE